MSEMTEERLAEIEAVLSGSTRGSIEWWVNAANDLYRDIDRLRAENERLLKEIENAKHDV